jgi:hypothetical protein
MITASYLASGGFCELTTADLSPVPAKTVNNSAAEPDTRRFWHCPMCGVWAQTDSYGNVVSTSAPMGAVFGSGEPRAFTVRALSEEGQDALPGRWSNWPIRWSVHYSGQKQR